MGAKKLTAGVVVAAIAMMLFVWTFYNLLHRNAEVGVTFFLEWLFGMFGVDLSNELMMSNAIDVFILAIALLIVIAVGGFSAKAIMNRTLGVK